jgi:pantoate--beta-alanine ligase
VVVCLCAQPVLIKDTSRLEEFGEKRERDFSSLEQEDVDYTFMAGSAHFLADDHRTFVQPQSFTECFQRLETEEYLVILSTVYFKMLNLFHPTFVFMGRNDYTDFLLLKRIIRDYSFSTEVVLCPTVRDEDGIPYSLMSRFFGEEQRQDAARLYAALRETRRLLLEGEQSATALRNSIRDMLEDMREREPFFVGVLDPETLQPLDKVEQQAVILIIARSGDFRLVDNIVYRHHED